MTCFTDSYPSFLLANMRSLRSKIDELHVFTRATSPAIVAITESWLNDCISNDELYLTGYSGPVRYDRCNGKKGGGVCVYIDSRVSFSPINFSDCPQTIEYVSFIIAEPSMCFLILYIPPNLRSSDVIEISTFLNKCLSYFIEQHPLSRIIVAGDLNTFPCDIFSGDFGLSQTVQTPTRGSAILDKIFVDPLLKTKYSIPVTCPAFGLSDHLAVYMKPFNSQWHVTHVKKVFDLRRSHVSNFVHALQCAPWDFMYSPDLSLEEKCSLFYEFIDTAMSVIPQTFVEMSSRDKAWMTPILKNMINLRYDAFRSGNMLLYEHFKDKVRSEISKAKHSWVNKCTMDNKSIWTIVREMCDLKPKSSILFEAMIKGHDSPNCAAEAFAQSFHSYFSLETDFSTIPDDMIENLPPWVTDSSPDTVYSMMLKLKSKSPGVDLLSARLIREAAHVLCYPVSHLFTESISIGQVPTIWKTANVVPIPKNGKFDCCNFRPISLLPIIAKILESIVLKSVYGYLQNVSGNDQFAYRRKTSTVHAQIAAHDFVTSHLEAIDSRGAILLSFDLRRAFDSLSHRAIIDTLISAALPRNFIIWIMSYLRDRQYRVSLQNIAFSAFRNMTSGVPQGSVLSPQIFVAHMGSLNVLTAGALMVKYADDVLVVIPVYSDTDIDQCVSSEQSNIDIWCRSHGLSLNTDKTKCMFIRRGVPPIVRDTVFCSSIKFLGVIFNSSCNWDEHIDYICKNASRRIYALRRLKAAGISKSDLITVFNAFVRSIIEYNSSLFVGLNKKNNDRLRKLFRLCHHIICGHECRNECLGDVSSRRFLRARKLFDELLHPQNTLHHLYPRRLRYSNHLEICLSRTHRREVSFIPFCTMLYNANM